jgi:AraC-like DNA-binding protein
VLSCGYTTPISGTIGEREGVGSINLIFSGAARFGSGQQELLINEQRPLFFSPGQEYTYLIDHHFNDVVFHVDLKRLKQTAAAIAGLGISERRFAPNFDYVRAAQTNTPRQRQLLAVLAKTFSLLDHPELETSGDLQHLALDDLIYRNLALLLCPQLETFTQQDPLRRTQRERIFEELLEWARAHLHGAISLSDLEQRSGYSRRNLQLVFQQRFGCGPIQWVRRERLEQARRDLLQPEPGDSVGSIASRYGFSSLSVFSRDFHARYGLRPSELLREGRGPAARS